MPDSLIVNGWDTNVNYVDNRRVTALTELSDDPNLVSVAEQADGNSDGNVLRKEIDLLETPRISSRLFPEEKAALPALRNLFAIPEATAKTVAPVKNLEFKLALPKGETMFIEDLPRLLRKTAERLQLVRNGDNNPQTIGVDDVLWAQADANTDLFTAQDRENLEKMTQVVCVLPPRTQTQVLFEGHGVSVCHAADLALVSSTIGSFPENPKPEKTFVYPEIGARRLQISAPTGWTVLVRAADTSSWSSAKPMVDAVIKGNGATQDFAIDKFGLANTGVWIQVINPQKTVVENINLKIDGGLLAVASRPEQVWGRTIDRFVDKNTKTLSEVALTEYGIEVPDTSIGVVVPDWDNPPGY